MIDTKDLLHKVQLNTGLDKRKTEQLYKAFILAVKHNNMNLKEVDLEGVGYIVPKKHLEFVFTDRQSGQELLYPPRIAVRFKPVRYSL